MVWQRGTGQATYNLQIKDGQANLQLSFQLGKPDDHHNTHACMENLMITLGLFSILLTHILSNLR